MIVTIIILTENERTPGRHVGRPFCPPVIKEKRYDSSPWPRRVRADS